MAQAGEGGGVVVDAEGDDVQAGVARDEGVQVAGGDGSISAMSSR